MKTRTILQLIFMTVIVLLSNFSLFSQDSDVAVFDVQYVLIGDIEQEYNDGKFENAIKWGDPSDVTYKVVLDMENDRILFGNKAKSAYYIESVIDINAFHDEEGNDIEVVTCKAYDEEDIFCNFIIYRDKTNEKFSFVAKYSDMGIGWITYEMKFTEL